MAEGDDMPVFENHFEGKESEDAKNPTPAPLTSLSLDQTTLPNDVLNPLNQLTDKFSELYNRIKELEEENKGLRDELSYKERKKNADHIDIGSGPIEVDAVPTTRYEDVGMEESGITDYAQKQDEKVHFEVGYEETVEPSSKNYAQPSASLPVGGAVPKQPQSISTTGGREAHRTSVDEQRIKQELYNALHETAPPPTPARPVSFSSDDQLGGLVQQIHLQFIADNLDMNKWPTFMRILGVPDTEIDRIRHDYQGVVEQKYQTLNFWKNEEGTKATPERLIQTLIKRKERLIAEKFCKHFPEFKPILDVDLGRRKLKKSNSANPLGSPTKEMAGLTHSVSEMEIDTDYYKFSGPIAEEGKPSSATNPSLAYKPGMAQMESTLSHSDYYQFTGPKQDEAVPTSPPSYAANRPSNDQYQGQSSSSMQFTPKTPIESIFRSHLKNETDGEINRLQTQLLLFRGFTDQGRQSFQKNLLKYQTDGIFHQTIEDGIKKKTNWFEVIEFWAKSILSSDISTSDPPPHFLWNFFLALRESRLIDLHNCIKSFLKSGSVGPCLPYTQPLTDTKWSLLNDVSQQLEIKVPGAADWRAMAEEHGLSEQIPLWQQRNEGAKHVIAVYKTRAKTVGDLYAWLCSKKRHDIVGCMEDLKYLIRR